MFVSGPLLGILQVPSNEKNPPSHCCIDEQRTSYVSVNGQFRPSTVAYSHILRSQLDRIMPLVQLFQNTRTGQWRCTASLDMTSFQHTTKPFLDSSHSTWHASHFLAGRLNQRPWLPSWASTHPSWYHLPHPDYISISRAQVHRSQNRKLSLHKTVVHGRPRDGNIFSMMQT